MQFPFDRPRLEALLHSYPSLRIGVIGDFTLDGYWYADMTRSEISREAPLYPRPVVGEKYSLGGSANVAWNLVDLGVGEIDAFTVFGEDWRGQILSQKLTDLGISSDGIIYQPSRVTPFFGKIILSGLGDTHQEDARIDFINTQPLTIETEKLLIEKLTRKLPELDALIVADYQINGVITPAITESLKEITLNNPGKIYTADSRCHIGKFTQMIIKPNEVEAARLFFPQKDNGNLSMDELSTAALHLSSKENKPVYITIGKKGCMLFNQLQKVIIPAIPVSPPIDTVGAGDAFLAHLTTALAAGASPVEAGYLANLSAAVTIKKLGITGTARPSELLSLHDQNTLEA